MKTHTEIALNCNRIVEKHCGYVLASDLLETLEVLRRTYEIDHVDLDTILVKEADVLFTIRVLYNTEGQKT